MPRGDIVQTGVRFERMDIRGSLHTFALCMGFCASAAPACRPRRAEALLLAPGMIGVVKGSFTQATSGDHGHYRAWQARCG